MKGNFLKTTAAAAMAAALLSSCSQVIGNTAGQSYTGGGNSSGEAADTPDTTDTTDTEKRSVPASENEAEPVTEPFSLDVSVPEVYKLKGSTVIEGFEAVMQEPELPTGCEVTSLTDLLNYLGFDIDKLTLCDNFMPISLSGEVVMNEAYVGNPRYDGFGCNANVMVQTADKFFASVDSPCYAVDLTGLELNALLWQIDNGRPVMAWSTIDLTVSYPEFVWKAGNGQDLIFDWYQHCIVIYGYDLSKNEIYVADPLKGNTSYSLDQFENIYGIMGKQAVLICGDSETKGHHITTDAEREVTMKSLNEMAENAIPGYVYEEGMEAYEQPLPEEKSE